MSGLNGWGWALIALTAILLAIHLPILVRGMWARTDEHHDVTFTRDLPASGRNAIDDTEGE